MNLEIEKKYLVNKLPENLDSYENKDLMQGYISSNPVLRLRRSGSEFIFTYKNGDNGLSLVREEFESSLTEEQFKKLWKLVSGNKIIKTRYYIPLNKGLVAELDIYHDYLSGLITVEVEFESVEQASAFVPPDWFGDDVTFDYRYRNSSLAKNPPPNLHML